MLIVKKVLDTFYMLYYNKRNQTSYVRFETENSMKSERLFEILLYLLEKKKTTAVELAGQFQVSVRTIYRDIDALSRSGIPVYTTSGNQGGIYLMEEYTLNRTVFSEKEKESLLLAMKTLQTIPFFTQGAGIEKIASLFQKKAPEHSWLEINFAHWGDNGFIGDDFFPVIRDAITGQRRLQISYVNQKGESGERIIEPLKLVFQHKDWYLYAYCCMREDFRFFKLNRVAAMRQMDEMCIHDYREYSGVEAVKPAAYVGEKITFRGIFEPSALSYLYDMLPGAAFEKLPEGKVQVSAEVREDAWFHSFLLFFGPDVTAIEPPELAETIRKLHQNAAQKQSPGQNR